MPQNITSDPAFMLLILVAVLLGATYLFPTRPEQYIVPQVVVAPRRSSLLAPIIISLVVGAILGLIVRSL